VILLLRHKNRGRQEGAVKGDAARFGAESSTSKEGSFGQDFLLFLGNGRGGSGVTSRLEARKGVERKIEKHAQPGDMGAALAGAGISTSFPQKAWPGNRG